MHVFVHLILCYVHGRGQDGLAGPVDPKALDRACSFGLLTGPKFSLENSMLGTFVLDVHRVPPPPQELSHFSEEKEQGSPKGVFLHLQEGPAGARVFTHKLVSSKCQQCVPGCAGTLGLLI